MKKYSSMAVENKIINRAGVVIKLNDKILAVQSAFLPVRSFGIPNLTIDSGESELDTALRSFYESTGIQLTKTVVDPSPESIQIYSPNGSVREVLTYYIANINSTQEIGIPFETITLPRRSRLDIAWCGFIPIKLAYELFQQSQLIILDRLQ